MSCNFELLKLRLPRNIIYLFPVQVMQGYGMTEGMIACTEDLDTPYESVGRLSPNNELIVRDTDSGRKCERNEVWWH